MSDVSMIISKHAYRTSRLTFFLLVEALTLYDSSDHHRLLAVYREHQFPQSSRSKLPNIVLHVGCHWVFKYSEVPT
jgi:hypothetical protein